MSTAPKPRELPNRQLLDIEELFEKIRWQMGAVPARLEVRDVKETAYWKQMLVVLGYEHVQQGGMAFVEDVSYHELGHPYLPWEVPGTFANAVNDTQFVKNLSGDTWTPNTAHAFLNIVYDTIDDTLGAWEFGRNPLVTRETQEKVDPVDLSGYIPGTDKILEWLRAFREAIMKKPFSTHICPEVQKAARASLEIIRRTWDNRIRVQRICELLYPLVKEDFDRQGEAIKERLKKLGVGPSGTIEGDDIDKMLEGLMIQDEQTRKIAGDLIGQLCPGIRINWGFEELWQAAGRKVRFRLNLKNRAPAEALRAGDAPWVVGMPMRELDVVRTLEARGLFVAGITTLRAQMVQGPGTFKDAPEPQRMAINCDVSGSMHNTPTLRALFSFIREAQRRQKPVAVHLFADRIYAVDFSMNHRSVAQQIYEHYRDAGGGNSVAGPERLENLLRSGDLLTYITDFGLDDTDQARASRILRALKSKGVAVIFIAMFEHHQAACSGLDYVACKDMEDLADITLKTI
ncbi:hypothetical protein [Geoalkalibacter halelectricus]|uniref:hypothetical protein n=1 Tax=Geoalkalibacter halelectricus TaxID=2847045 RepID=UPI003D1AC177